MQDLLDEIDIEWILVNASKELLSFVKHSPNITYSDAIKFAKENYPEIFENSKTGLIDKIVGIYELISPSGQNSWCLFLPNRSFFVLNLDIRLIKQNGNGLCWRATCQG